MTSNNENEDESAEPMCRPMETDQEVGPAQQIDVALPPNEAASDPVDEDKPLPVRDEIPSSRTDEDEPVSVQNQVSSSQTDAAPKDACHKDKPSHAHGEVTPVESSALLYDANLLDKPVSAKHEAPSTVTNAPLNNASHEDKPIHPQNLDKPVPAKHEAPSAVTNAPLNNASHEDKPIHPQNTIPSSQIEVPFQDDSNENKPIHPQNTVPLSQTEVPSHNDIHEDILHPEKDNVLSFQTEAPINDACQVEEKSSPQRPHQDSTPQSSLDVGNNLPKPEVQVDVDGGPEGNEILNCKSEAYVGDGTVISSSHHDTVKLNIDAKAEPSELPEIKSDHDVYTGPKQQNEPATPLPVTSHMKSEVGSERELSNGKKTTEMLTPESNGNSSSKRSFLLEDSQDGSESGTEEEQLAFMKELHNFFRERSMEFKPPKFYGEGLNCLKLWRSVMRLGGYDKVTAFKLWRQVGESFKPPKTCTTVSWTFRGFYEKALLDYERHKTGSGELSTPIASNSEPMSVDNQASGSGRARRDAAARAMQGWHSERLLDNGEVSYPIIKDKNSISLQKHDKQLKNLGLLKRKKPSYDEDTVKAARTKPAGPQVDVEVVDIGPPADWVKINVQRTKDSYEVYALVPGLLREEVRVQSDPAGRLVISGEPEHPDNPWGVTAFKKVVSLPSRIDPHQTSAVVTLHGQLLVRVPFERSA